MSFDLRRLLGISTPQHIQAAPNSNLQGFRDPAGVDFAQAAMAAPINQMQQPNGQINVPGMGMPMPHLQLRNLLGISGGSPQGFPGAEAGYPQPNFQQAVPLDGQAGIQGVVNPGATPGQGGYGVPNPQANRPKRHSPQITF